MLSEGEVAIAKQGFESFFTSNPGVKNPTDLNSELKWEWFFRHAGWDEYRLMQRARKCHTKKNGMPYPWTQARYWDNHFAVTPEVVRQKEILLDEPSEV